VTSGPQGQSERRGFGAFSRIQLDRPEKTPGSELIQPGPIKHSSSNSQALAKGCRWPRLRNRLNTKKRFQLSGLAALALDSFNALA
jgi:hypothetical protein